MALLKIYTLIAECQCNHWHSVSFYMDGILAQSASLNDTGLVVNSGVGSGVFSTYLSADDRGSKYNVMVPLFEYDADGFITIVTFPSLRITGSISWSSGGQSASFSATWGIENGDAQYALDQVVTIFSGSKGEGSSISVVIPGGSITLTPSIPKVTAGLIYSSSGSHKTDYSHVASFIPDSVTLNATYKTLKIA